jgi:ketosteroid isomerase-like protein
VTQGARSPEELKAVFEDAFVTRDAEAVRGMFAEGAVLATGEGPDARGGEEIGRLATALWTRDRAYVAEPLRVVQARDTALVLADGAINVLRRGNDGAWRYAIALLSLDSTATGEAMTQQSTQAPSLEPLAVPKGEGEARWWFGALAEIKATAADTGGLMSIVEVTEPPGIEAPLHVHHRTTRALDPGGRGHLRGRRHDNRGDRGRLRLRAPRHPPPLHGRRPGLPREGHSAARSMGTAGPPITANAPTEPLSPSGGTNRAARRER